MKRSFFPDTPTGSGSPYLWDDAKIKELIEKFAFEAFRRRQPEPEYVAGLYDIFQKHRNAGMNHRDAMIEVIGIILASPSFLFVQEESSNRSEPSLEPPAAAHSRDSLSNRELAIRLSFFLWSCPPDEELYAADLSDAAVFRKTS